MGDSWIVDNLNAALNTWNGKLAEIWQLLTESPQTFRGGQVWSVMVGIHGALQAIGYGLLVLFFAIGVVKTCGSFVEVKRPEHALKLFIRFALAKAAVTYGLELMQAVFSIVQGTVSTVITQSGTSGMNSTTLPQELVDAINDVGFWDSIPLWAVTLIGGLLITVLSFVMILTVYGRMFSLWMYAAIAPIPLAAFAGEPTANVGKNFIRSYAGVCLQGLVIALSCVIFSALAASPPSVDTSASVVTGFTALQIAGEEIKNQMMAVVMGINSLTSISSIGNEVLNNILTQHVITNSYLDDITKYTKLLNDIKADISEVRVNTKGLSTR